MRKYVAALLVGAALCGPLAHAQNGMAGGPGAQIPNGGAGTQTPVSSTVVSGSAVSLTSGASADITTVSVGAGDWQCTGNVYVSSAGNITAVEAYVSTGALNTNPGRPNGGGITQSAGYTSANQIGQPAGSLRVVAAGATTVRLGVTPTFTTTATGYGSITCR